MKYNNPFSVLQSSLFSGQVAGKEPPALGGLHICFTGRIGFFTGKPQSDQEVSVIRRMAPIHLIVYFPKTKEGKEALTKRAADVHASSVHQRLKALNCPADQKLELLNAVIETVRKRFQESSPIDSP